MLVDEHAHFGRFGSSSLANTEAASGSSLALQRGSLLQHLQSLTLAVASRTLRSPASASAWRTQRRNASRLRPRSRATAAIGRAERAIRLVFK